MIWIAEIFYKGSTPLLSTGLHKPVYYIGLWKKEVASCLQSYANGLFLTVADVDNSKGEYMYKYYVWKGDEEKKLMTLTDAMVVEYRRNGYRVEVT